MEDPASTGLLEPETCEDGSFGTKVVHGDPVSGDHKVADVGSCHCGPADGEVDAVAVPGIDGETSVPNSAASEDD